MQLRLAALVWWQRMFEPHLSHSSASEAGCLLSHIASGYRGLAAV